MKPRVIVKQPITEEPKMLHSSFNQETLPERRYIGDRDYYNSALQIGFIYNGNERYALFETRMSNKFYYHTIDDTRFGIRIVIQSKNDQQLFDGDQINIPELNNVFTVKLYEYSGNRYNPII